MILAHVWRMVKMDTRNLSQSAQDAIRAKVITAVKGGMTQVAAAATFGVSRQSIIRWMKMGESALVSRRRGHPKGPALLNDRQITQIRQLIVDRSPDQLKLPFYLWTRDGVRMLIKDRYGMEVSLSSVGRYLRQWNFSAQKPIRRAIERDPVAVKRWLEDEYPQIVKQAKRENAHILWADETNVRSDHAAGRSFSPKGKTPVILATGRRFSCNVISAISNRGHLQFMTFRKSFTAPVFIEFLRRLIRKAPQKVFLILDGHPVHKARLVSSWLERHGKRIRVFTLPAYCPELNPDELLNNDLKTNAVGRSPAFTAHEMHGNIRSYLCITQRNPQIVRNFFQEEHVRYAS